MKKIYIALLVIVIIGLIYGAYTSKVYESNKIKSATYNTALKDSLYRIITSDIKYSDVYAIDLVQKWPEEEKLLVIVKSGMNHEETFKLFPNGYFGSIPIIITQTQQ